MVPLLILKTGTSHPHIIDRFGDMDDWVVTHLDVSRRELVIEDAVNGRLPANPGDFGGIIITGSHAMVTDPDLWIRRLEEWLRTAFKKSVPILGICFGHQVLANALGGVVDYHPGGREFGTVMLRTTTDAESDPLFMHLPESFAAHASHAQSVRALPPGAVLLAANDFEPCHAFRMGSTAWGIQFHPEFSTGLMRAYIECQTEAPEEQGVDPGHLEKTVIETPEAHGVLLRFRDFAMKRVDAA